MQNTFVKATKKRSKARIALDGPSGSGKTYSALIAATVLADGGKIAVVDTEHGSASLYSDDFTFDVMELSEYNPANYIGAIELAENLGYAVVVLDSLSHAWEGEGGALDLVDQATKRSRSGNSYTAWRDVTPLHRKLVDAMLQTKMHVVATMRTKMDYVQEKDEKTGKTNIRKVGMAPIQRQGMEYEFTVVGDLDVDHNLAISKTRCRLLDGKVEYKPGAKFWKVFYEWLNSGEDAPVQTAKAESNPAEEIPEPAEDEMLFRGKIVKKTGTLGSAVNTDADLKAWFKTIVDKFGAPTHYRNHIKDHFGLESAVNLTYEQAFAMHEHKFKGVEYPFQWAGKKAKVETKAETKSADPLTKKIETLQLSEVYAKMRSELGMGDAETDEKAAKVMTQVVDMVEKGIVAANEVDDLMKYAKDALA